MVPYFYWIQILDKKKFQDYNIRYMSSSKKKNIYIYIRYVFNMFDFRLQKKYVWFQDFCTNIIQKTLCTCSICLIIKNLYFSEYFLFLWQMGVLLKKKKTYLCTIRDIVCVLYYGFQCFDPQLKSVMFVQEFLFGWQMGRSYR